MQDFPYGLIPSGRKDFFFRFRNDCLEQQVPVRWSIYGAPGSGKTDFVRQALNAQPARDRIVLFCNLKLCSNWLHFWKKSAREIYRTLLRRQIISSQLKNMIEKILLQDEKVISDASLQEDLQEVFEYLQDTGIKVILVIENYDHASVLFKNNPVCFEILKDLLLMPHIFTVLISNAEAKIIEEEARSSAALHSIFESCCFSFYTAAQMQAYWENLKQIRGKALSVKQKQKIEETAGRSAHILHLLEKEMHRSKGSVDIEQIVESIRKPVNDFYQSFLDQLIKENKLQEIFRVLQSDSPSSSFKRKEYEGQGYLFQDRQGIFVISRYFEKNFLCDQYCRLSLPEQFALLERMLRKLVQSKEKEVFAYLQIAELDRNEKQLQVLNNVSSSAGLVQSARKDLQEMKPDAAYFDVINIPQSARIIVECREIFSDIFQNGSDKQWEYTFESLVKVRNRVCHGHEPGFTGTDRLKAYQLCGKMFDTLGMHFDSLNTITDQKTDSVTQDERTEKFDAVDDLKETSQPEPEGNPVLAKDKESVGLESFDQSNAAQEKAAAPCENSSESAAAKKQKKKKQKKKKQKSSEAVNMQIIEISKNGNAFGFLEGWPDKKVMIPKKFLPAINRKQLLGKNILCKKPEGKVENNLHVEPAEDL